MILLSPKRQLGNKESSSAAIHGVLLSEGWAVDPHDGFCERKISVLLKVPMAHAVFFQVLTEAHGIAIGWEATERAMSALDTRHVSLCLPRTPVTLTCAAKTSLEPHEGVDTERT